MIKFFRKIRQKLLSENRFSKYLIYAIGEIILVVIGILIALSINNWNQRKKNETKITNILHEIQGDILIDLETANMIFNYHLFTDSVSKKILNKEYTPDDYKSGKFSFIGYNYRDFKTTSNGYDNLKSNLDNIPAKYEHLIPDIKDLYVSLNTNIEVYNEIMRNTVYANLEAKSKFEWYQDALVGNESIERMEYYLNDKAYKNLVALYMSHRMAIFYASNEYRVKAINIYSKIHEATMSHQEIPEIVNYNNLSSNEHIGSYILKETINPEGRWDSSITVVERHDSLLLTFPEKDYELNLLCFDENTFFGDPAYYRIAVFNRSKEGLLYLSNNINSSAVYEKK